MQNEDDTSPHDAVSASEKIVSLEFSIGDFDNTPIALMESELEEHLGVPRSETREVDSSTDSCEDESSHCDAATTKLVIKKLNGK